MDFDTEQALKKLWAKIHKDEQNFCCFKNNLCNEIIACGGAGANIYNSDGALTANRVVNIANNNLLFTNLSQGIAAENSINNTFFGIPVNYSKIGAVGSLIDNNQAYTILYSDGVNTSGIILGLNAVFSNTDNIQLNPGSYVNNFNSIQISKYPSSRDNSGASFPVNFLYTDSSGNLYSAPTSLISGGGSPASPNTSIQFNNSGSFGGSAAFTFDGRTLQFNQGIPGTTLLQIDNVTSFINIGDSYNYFGGSNIQLSTAGITNFINGNAVLEILPNGDSVLAYYPNSRDDSGSTEVKNMLYTDGSGRLLSAPPVKTGATGSEPIPYLGQFYFDTTLTKMKFWNGAVWAIITSTP